MKNILKSFLFSLIIISFIPACSENDYQNPGDDETGSISFHVEWRGAPSLSDEISGNTRALNCVASNIETVTFEIVDENDNPLADDSFECIAGEGIVYGVPAGTGRKLIVEGKDLLYRILYRGVEEGIDVTAGEHEDIGEVVCEPMIVIGASFLQYRTYEDAAPAYRGWLDFTRNHNPIIESDITQITLKNSAGSPVYISETSFWSSSYIKGEWNKTMLQVDYSGLMVDTGFSIGFPEYTSLPEDIYTYEVTTGQEGLLSTQVYFPGETTLPTVVAASMNYQWLGDGSLRLTWTNPIGDFDLIRIVLYDQNWKDLLFVTLPADESELTLPAAQAQNIINFFNPDQAIWIVQTRSYTETDDNNNYARGISNPVFIPWPSYTNSLGMMFKFIQAGTFTMGSPLDELGRYSDETQYEVTLTQPFYMQTTEVTQGQWEAVMGSNPSNFSSCGSDCPVELVSWNDIQNFLATLNSMGEGTYNLPTEAQWEYAARAGSTTAFANGDISIIDCSYDVNLDAMGWYCYNAGSTTHPVAQKDANAWGLYDMHGNVYEWCQDWFGTYPSTPVSDPTGSVSGSIRVRRGGSLDRIARNCRSAQRSSNYPDVRNSAAGFRLLRMP